MDMCAQLKLSASLMSLMSHLRRSHVSLVSLSFLFARAAQARHWELGFSTAGAKQGSMVTVRWAHVLDLLPKDAEVTAQGLVSQP
jgi:hypothetical protein